jgi:hypothetical protein
MKRVEEELAAMQEARIAAAGQADAVQADVAAVFNAAAERIEKAARLLGDAGDGRHIVLG